MSISCTSGWNSAFHCTVTGGANLEWTAGDIKRAFTNGQAGGSAGGCKSPGSPAGVTWTYKTGSATPTTHGTDQTALSVGGYLSSAGDYLLCTVATPKLNGDAKCGCGSLPN